MERICKSERCQIIFLSCNFSYSVTLLIYEKYSDFRNTNKSVFSSFTSLLDYQYIRVPNDNSPTCGRRKEKILLLFHPKPMLYFYNPICQSDVILVALLNGSFNTL